jgi:flagellar protein FliL
MAVAEDEGMSDSGGAGSRPVSTLVFILILVGLTVLAGGAGFFGGLQILASAEQTVRRNKEKEAPALHGELQRMNAAGVKVLSPIVTNLLGEPPVWIRIEASLVFEDEVPDDADLLATRISEDIIAYLRTLEVEQIQGAIGFQHLGEDLNDRARVRSNGRVRELIIQGLIIE